MRLRTTLISFVSAVMVISGLGMTWVFRYHLAQEAAAADRSGAAKDMDRLLLALNQQVAELNVVLGSWSNFTAFYEHARKPSAVFRADDLSPESLASGGLDWLNLLDAEGTVVEHSEVPQPDGTTPVRAAYADPVIAETARVGLRDMVRRRSGCAVLGAGTRLAIGCYKPLLPSDGKGTPRGTVFVGRWLSDEMLARVRAQTGLQFEITARPQGNAEPRDLNHTDGKFVASALVWTEIEDRIHVDSKVLGMHGRHIADLHMDWPRESPKRMQSMLQLVTLAMAGLITVTALGLIYVCDSLLIRRLEGMRRDLGRILEDEQWDGRVRTVRNDELTDLSHYINNMLDIIRAKIALVQEQSLTDPLTGLPNRRRFDMRMESTLSQFRRDGRPAALVLFDIDYFKKFNDTYGHPKGDDVLVGFAGCLRQAARRPVDLPARLGGEEFAVLMPLTDVEGARHCAERARSALQELAIEHTGNEGLGVVTVSAGLALVRAGDTAGTLYSRADAALYAAKREGRNRLSEQ
ncbi:diguanylate cyclase [Curvibacter sp. APW13]|uniref:sensor domain-containing diguanylate cyclase n=1 Tax=Curvibacter sp. APW13 TaxID=3077236 RepID=UPI0028DDEDAC|nr:diguanylate cyclase [Curvibacter sp. APW13]MDT8990292.1 diguanylate cyclase [Curvibacter sp. APW13]